MKVFLKYFKYLSLISRLFTLILCVVLLKMSSILIPRITLEIFVVVGIVVAIIVKKNLRMNQI